MKLIKRLFIITVYALSLCSCRDNYEQSEVTIRRLKVMYPQLEVDKLTSGNGFVARDSVTNRIFYFSGTRGCYFDNPGHYAPKDTTVALFEWQEVLCKEPALHIQFIYASDLANVLGHTEDAQVYKPLVK